MNKTLILDDRLERRNVLMKDKDTVELNNCVNKGWLTFITELPTSRDELEKVLTNYSMIAIHRSWMVDHGVENLIEEIIRRNNDYYIVYSGGISQNLLLNGRMRLNMNAASFYSENLPVMIKRYATGETTQPLLELLYGMSWKLALLLEYRNLIWLGGSEYDYDKEYDLRVLIADNARIPNEQLSLDWIEREIQKEKYNFTLL
jgi:hypothetical protein